MSAQPPLPQPWAYTGPAPVAPTATSPADVWDRWFRHLELQARAVQQAIDVRRLQLEEARQAEFVLQHDDAARQHQERIAAIDRDIASRDRNTKMHEDAAALQRQGVEATLAIGKVMASLPAPVISFVPRTERELAWDYYKDLPQLTGITDLQAVDMAAKAAQAFVRRYPTPDAPTEVP